MVPQRKNPKPKLLPTLKIFFPAALILAALNVGEMLLKPAFAGEVTLQDDSVSISFDSHSGTLIRFEDKKKKWNIERRPELGNSFRLFAPLPDRRWNPVLGPKQTATEVKKLSDHEVRLQWKNLISENGGELPLTLTAEVTLTNGMLTFAATLENDSSLTVESIDYPCFGDFSPPSRGCTNMTVWAAPHSSTDGLAADELYPHFHNEKGYWGVFWPTKILESDHSHFCLIQTPGEGVYIGVGTTSSDYRWQYVFEQHPGLISTITEIVPPTDSISSVPVHLEFRVCHLIFQKPHSTMKLMPVVVQFYQGDQHTGSELHKP